jgi:hypothetical protein
MTRRCLGKSLLVASPAGPCGKYGKYGKFSASFFGRRANSENEGCGNYTSSRVQRLKHSAHSAHSAAPPQIGASCTSWERCPKHRRPLRASTEGESRDPRAHHVARQRPFEAGKRACGDRGVFQRPGSVRATGQGCLHRRKTSRAARRAVDLVCYVSTFVSRRLDHQRKERRTSVLSEGEALRNLYQQAHGAIFRAQ